MLLQMNRRAWISICLVLYLLGRSSAPVQAQADTFLYLPSLLTNAGNYVTNVRLNPTSPANLNDNQAVTVTFDYGAVQTDGVRIWALPYTNGALSPGYSYTGSNIEPTGSGTLSRQISIWSGATVVDAVHIEMKTADAQTLLFETDVAVAYSFTP